jgi:hypothetical protein
MISLSSEVKERAFRVLELSEKQAARREQAHER